MQSALRIGWGCQSRTFEDGTPLFLGGSSIAHERGLGGRLRGDVVVHAAIEALLSACGLPNYELMFSEDEEADDTEPLVVLAQTVTGLYRKRLEGIANIVVKLAAREPELVSYRQDMILQLASALQLQPDQVTVSIEQYETHLADLPPGTVRCQASLACIIAQAAASRSGKARKAEQAQMELIDDAADRAGDIDENLPKRAREFEQAVKSKLPPLPKADPPKEGAKLIVYTDGASRGNPGPASTGWVVLSEEGLLVHEGGEMLGQRTNNQAEYLAVQAVADWIEINLGRHFTLDLRLDSELVVRQLRGEWKVKDGELKKLAMKVLNSLMYFDSFEIKHVPRRENTRADALANRVLDKEKAEHNRSEN